MCIGHIAVPIAICDERTHRRRPPPPQDRPAKPLSRPPTTTASPHAATPLESIKYHHAPDGFVHILFDGAFFIRVKKCMEIDFPCTMVCLINILQSKINYTRLLFYLLGEYITHSSERARIASNCRWLTGFSGVGQKLPACMFVHQRRE